MADRCCVNIYKKASASENWLRDRNEIKVGDFGMFERGVEGWEFFPRVGFDPYFVFPFSGESIVLNEFPFFEENPPIPRVCTDNMLVAFNSEYTVGTEPFPYLKTTDDVVLEEGCTYYYGAWIIPLPIRTGDDIQFFNAYQNPDQFWFPDSYIDFEFDGFTDATIEPFVREGNQGIDFGRWRFIGGRITIGSDIDGKIGISRFGPLAHHLISSIGIDHIYLTKDNPPQKIKGTGIRELIATLPVNSQLIKSVSLDNARFGDNFQSSATALTFDVLVSGNDNAFACFLDGSSVSANEALARKYDAELLLNDTVIDQGELSFSKYRVDGSVAYATALIEPNDPYSQLREVLLTDLNWDKFAHIKSKDVIENTWDGNANSDFFVYIHFESRVEPFNFVKRDSPVSKLLFTANQSQLYPFIYVKSFIRWIVEDVMCVKLDIEGDFLNSDLFAEFIFNPFFAFGEMTVADLNDVNTSGANFHYQYILRDEPVLDYLDAIFNIWNLQLDFTQDGMRATLFSRSENIERLRQPQHIDKEYCPDNMECERLSELVDCYEFNYTQDGGDTYLEREVKNPKNKDIPFANEKLVFDRKCANSVSRNVLFSNTRVWPATGSIESEESTGILVPRSHCDDGTLDGRPSRNFGLQETCPFEPRILRYRGKKDVADVDVGYRVLYYTGDHSTFWTDPDAWDDTEIYDYYPWAEFYSREEDDPSPYNLAFHDYYFDGVLTRHYLNFRDWFANAIICRFPLPINKNFYNRFDMPRSLLIGDNLYLTKGITGLDLKNPRVATVEVLNFDPPIRVTDKLIPEDLFPNYQGSPIPPCAVDAGDFSSITACNDGCSIDLSSIGTFVGPDTYEFISGPQTITPSGSVVNLDGVSTGPYSFARTVVDAATGCQDQTTIVINVINPPLCGLPQDYSVCSCSPPINLFEFHKANYDEGGYWEIDPPLPVGDFDSAGKVCVKPGDEGEYTIKYKIDAVDQCTNECDCETEFTFEVCDCAGGDPPGPCEVDAGSNNSIVVCNGSSCEIELFDKLAGTPDTGGSWDEPTMTLSFSGGYLGTVNFDGVAPGTYVATYTVVDPLDPTCTDSAQVTITVYDMPDAGADQTLDFCETDPLFDLNTLFTAPAAHEVESWFITPALPNGIFDAGAGTIDPEPGDGGTGSEVYTITRELKITGIDTECDSACTDIAEITVTIYDERKAGDNTDILRCSTDTVDLLSELANNYPGGDWVFLGFRSDCDFLATKNSADFSVDGGTVQTWNPGDPIGVNDNPQIADWSPLGCYYFEYTVVNGTCETTAILTVEIEDCTGPCIISAGDDTMGHTACSEAPCQPNLFGLITGSPDTGGTWNQVSGPSTITLTGGDLGTADFVGATPGMYQFRYYVEDPGDPTCNDESFHDVEVIQPADPGMGTQRNVCVPFPAPWNIPLLTGGTAGGTITVTPTDPNVIVMGDTVEFLPGSGSPTAVPKTYLVEYCHELPATINDCDPCKRCAVIQFDVIEEPYAGDNVTINVCQDELVNLWDVLVANSVTPPSPTGQWETLGEVNSTTCFGTTLNDAEFSVNGAPEQFWTIGTVLPGGHNIDVSLMSIINHCYGFRYRTTLGFCIDTANVNVVIDNCTPPCLANAGGDGAITVCNASGCSTDSRDHLGGMPDTGGTWTQLTGTTTLVITGGDLGTVDWNGVVPDTYELEYLIDLGGGCTDTAVLTVTVIDPSNAGNDVSVTLCEDDGPTDLFALITGSPDSGGVFSISPSLPVGSFFPSGVIDPAVGDAGVYTVTYTVDEGVIGDCDAVCNDSSTMTLTIEDCTPPPCTVDAGDNATITICNGAGCDPNLHNYLGGTPDSGGTWTQLTGPQSITLTNGFLGTLDANGVLAGTYTFEYTVVDPMDPTCTDSAVMTVIIRDVPNAGTDFNLDICETDGLYLLRPTFGGSLPGGTYNESYTITPSLPNGSFNTSTGTIDPAPGDAGTYTVVRTVGVVGVLTECDTECEDTATATITIDEEPNAGTDRSITICAGDLVDLFSELGGTPDTGGSWKFSKASADCVNYNLVTAQFQVDGGGVATYTNGQTVGTDHTPEVDMWDYPTYTCIRFTYTVTSGACSKSSVLTITIESCCGVNAGTGTSLVVCNASGCSFNLFDKLTGSPDTGGVWSQVSGPTISITGGDLGTVDFDGATSGSYQFKYRVEDPMDPTCFDEAFITVTVEDAPDAGDSFTVDLCESDGAFLSGPSFGGDSGAPPYVDTFAISPTPPAGTFNTSTGEYDPAPGDAGTYTITRTLKVVGIDPDCDADCTDTETATVNVFASGDAGLDGSVKVCNSSGCSLDLFDFLGGTPDTGGTWSEGSSTLSFSGGHLGTVDFNGVAPGVYFAVYTVGAGGCEDTATVTVTVVDAPDAGSTWTLDLCDTSNAYNTDSEFGGDPVGTSGLDISFTISPSLPNGTFNTSTGVIDPAPGDAGTYTITKEVKVTGIEPSCDAVCTDTETGTVNISVGGDPGTNGSVKVCNGSGCSLDMFNFLGGSPDTTGTWSEATTTLSFSGGHLGTVDFNGVAPGIYTARYTVGTGGCSAFADVTVEVVSAPDAGSTFSEDACEGDTINTNTFFGGTPNGASGYNISYTISPALPSGTFNTATGQISSATGDGGSGSTIYTITRTITTNGVDPACTAPCTDTETGTVEIFEDVSAGTASDIILCNDSGCSVDLIDHYSGFSVFGTRIWTQVSGPQSITPSGTNGTINLSGVTTGIYVFQLEIENGTCSDTETIQVEVYGDPDAGTDFTADICEGDTLLTAPTFGGTPNGASNYDISYAISPALPNGSLNTSTGVLTSAIGDGGAGSVVYTITRTVKVTGVDADCETECTDTATATIEIFVTPEAGTSSPITVCNGSGCSVDLIDDYSGYSAFGTRTWSFVSGPQVITPTGADGTVDFNGVAAGTYVFRLTIDNGNCDDTEDITVTVIDAPDAGSTFSFTLCDTSSQHPLDSNFGGTPQGTPGYTHTYSISPSLPNGTFNTSTGEVDPAPGDSGTYTVTKQVDVTGVTSPCSGACSDTETGTLIIDVGGNPGLSNSIIVCNASGCDTDLFTHLGGSPDTGGTWSEVTMTLSFSGGHLGTVNFNGVPAGTYSAVYSIGGGTCTATATITITVVDAPDAGNNTAEELCDDEAAQFLSWGGTPNGEPDLTYAYTITPSLPSGTFNTTTGEIDPAPGDAGTYTVTRTLSVTGVIGDCSGDCQDTATKTLTIYGSVSAGTSTAIKVCNDAGCSTDLIDHYSGFSPSAPRTWSFISGPQAINPTGTPGTVDFNGVATGTYIFELQVDNGTCTDSEQITVTVVAALDAGVDFTLDLCEDEGATDLSVLFGGGSGGGSVDEDYTISPALPNGTFNTSTGVIDPAPGDDGTYTVTKTLSYNDVISDCDNPCEDEAVATITIFEEVSAGIATNDKVCNSSGCSLDLIDLYSGYSTGFTRSWSFVSGPQVITPSGVNGTVDFNGVATGTYTFRLTITNGACMDTEDIQIEVAPPLDAGSSFTHNACEDSGAFGLGGLFGGTPAGGSVDQVYSISPSLPVGTFNTTTGTIDLEPGDAGTYTVTRTVSYNDVHPDCDTPCSDTQTATVEVDFERDAGTSTDFNVCRAAGCIVDVIDFYSGFGPGTRTWQQVSGPQTLIPSGPDGNVDFGGKLVGTYVFRLNVSGPICFDSTDVTVTVLDGLDAGSTFASTACEDSGPISTSALFGGDAAGGLIDEAYTISPSLPNGTFNTATGELDPAPGDGGTGSVVYTITRDVSYNDIAGDCDAACDDQETGTVEIFAIPNAGTSTPATVCNGSGCSLDLSTLFSGVSSFGTKVYTFVSGPQTITPSGSNADFSGVLVGTYTFRLTVNNGPCSDQQTVDVTVVNEPIAGSPFTQQTCETGGPFDSQLFFGGDPTGPGVSFAISPTLPNGSFNTSTGVVTPAVGDAGTGSTIYTITKTIVVPGVDPACTAACSDSESGTLEIFEDVDAGTSSGINVCNGAGCDTDLIDHYSGYSLFGTRSWSHVSGPQVITPSGADGNVDFNGVATGTYVFRLIITSGTCTDTEDITVNVRDVLDAGDTFMIDRCETAGVINTAVIFGGDAAGGSIDESYSISPALPNGTFNTSTGALDPATGDGGADNETYTITRTVSYNDVIAGCDADCDDSETATITIFREATTGTANTPLEFCNQSVCNEDLIDFLSGNWADTYEWTQISGPGSLTIADPDGTVDFNGATAGVYLIEVKAINGPCEDTLQFNITVRERPDAGADVTHTICECDGSLLTEGLFTTAKQAFQDQTFAISPALPNGTFNTSTGELVPAQGDNGTYTITRTLTITNIVTGCDAACTDTAELTLTIDEGGVTIQEQSRVTCEYEFRIEHPTNASQNWEHTVNNDDTVVDYDATCYVDETCPPDPSTVVQTDNLNVEKEYAMRYFFNMLVGWTLDDIRIYENAGGTTSGPIDVVISQTNTAVITAAQLQTDILNAIESYMTTNYSATNGVEYDCTVTVSGAVGASKSIDITWKIKQVVTSTWYGIDKNDPRAVFGGFTLTTFQWVRNLPQTNPVCNYTDPCGGSMSQTVSFDPLLSLDTAGSNYDTIAINNTAIFYVGGQTPASQCDKVVLEVVGDGCCMPSTYSWSNSETTATITVFDDDSTYTVTVTCTNSCVYSDSYTV